MRGVAGGTRVAEPFEHFAGVVDENRGRFRERRQRAELSLARQVSCQTDSREPCDQSNPRCPTRQTSPGLKRP